LSGLASERAHPVHDNKFLAVTTKATFHRSASHPTPARKNRLDWRALAAWMGCQAGFFALALPVHQHPRWFVCQPGLLMGLAQLMEGGMTKPGTTCTTGAPGVAACARLALCPSWRTLA
jgi:hypothetical protein